MSAALGRRFVGTSPILIGLAAVALASAWEGSDPARITLVVEGDLSFHCGTTPRGAYGRHSWIVRNAGQVPLKLRTRFTGGRSGFSLWQGEEHVIPPGVERTVSLTWPTSPREAVPYSGLAEVWTNDPGSPKVRFRVVGLTDSSGPLGPAGWTRP